MRITTVTATNFKGRSFEHSLEPHDITLVCGNNCAGKTAVLEAIALAALGYMPAEPKPVKTARDIYELYGGSRSMSVGIAYDTGTIARTWAPGKGGSVTYAGPEVSIVPAELFDPSAFTGLTGPQRTAYLLRTQSDKIGLTQIAVCASLSAAIKNTKLEENTRETEEALAEAAAFVVGRTSGGLQANEWLEGTQAALKDRKLVADQSVKRMQQTLQGLTQTATEVKPNAMAETLLAKTQADQLTVSSRIATLEQHLAETRRRYQELDVKQKKWLGGQKLRDELTALPEKMERPEEPDRAPLDAAQAALNSANSDYRYAATELSVERAALSNSATPQTCRTCGRTSQPSPEVTEQHRKRVEEAEKKEQALKSACSAAEKEAAFQKGLFEEKDRTMRRWAAVELERGRISGLILGIPQESCAEEIERVVQDGKDTAVAVTDAKAALTLLVDAAKVYAADVKRIIAMRADAASRARTEVELAACVARAQAAKAACECCAALAKEVVERAVKPLVETMNELCGGFLPDRVAYRDGELVLDGSGRGLRSASDSERLIIQAALCCALASQSPVRIAFIGRFESLDTDRQYRLVSTLEVMIESGKLDQAILIGVGSPAAGLVKRINVIELKGKE